MFITESQLEYLQKHSNFYKDKPMGFIFVNEWIRKGKHKQFIRYEDFSNFFCKWTDDTVECAFLSDHSGFLINFKERLCYVSDHKEGGYKVINFE